MSVRQIAEDKYIIDYYPDGRKGKRVRKVYTLPSREVAEAIERDLVSLNKNSKTSQSAGQATIDSLFPTYLKWCEQHKRETTVTDIESVYTNHISRVLGAVTVEKLRVGHINIYKRMRAGEKAIRGGKIKGIKRATMVSNRTIMKELSYLASFLKWCRRDMEMEIKPLYIEKLPHARPKPIVLSPEEVGSILVNLTPLPRAVVMLLYTMGLRLTEATCLRWEDVDFSNNVLRVVQKGGTWKILPMNKWAVCALQGLPRLGDWVFYSPRTKTHIYDIRKPLESARKAAGIDKKVNHHLFRHSIATHLMGLNVQTRLIQEYLGHAEIGSTDWYMHVNMAILAGATRGAFDFLDGIPGLAGMLTTQSLVISDISEAK